MAPTAGSSGRWRGDECKTGVAAHNGEVQNTQPLTPEELALLSALDSDDRTVKMRAREDKDAGRVLLKAWNSDTTKPQRVLPDFADLARQLMSEMDRDSIDIFVMCSEGLS